MRGSLVAVAAVAGAVTLGSAPPAEAKTVPYQQVAWTGPRSPAAASAVPLVVVVAPRAQPAGYAEVTGSPDATLDPAHVGAVGSLFTQDCRNVPVGVPPGGLAWHFILPQRAGTGVDDDIFADLSVVFETSGTARLTTFGPPNATHAWFVTMGDDVLLGGAADVYSTDPSAWSGEGETFSLSHVCFIPTTTTAQPSTTTSTSTTTTTSTTEPTSTTTAEATTSTEPVMSTTTAVPAVVATSIVTTTTSSVVSPASTTPGGGAAPGTTADPRMTADDLATTGNSSDALWFGIAFVGAGVVIVAVTRRRPTSE